MDVFSAVKENVTMLDLLEHFGITLNKKNFCKCPFHTEKTPSFSVSSSKQFYYCFGCGAKGSVIDFVMKYLNLSNLEAAKYLAKAFNIMQSEVSIRARYAYEQRKREIKEREAFENWCDRAFKTLAKYNEILQENSTEFDWDNELYVEALHNLELMQYYFDWLLEDPKGFFKTNRKGVERVDRRLNQLGYERQ